MLKTIILTLCVFVISCSQDEIDSHTPSPNTNSQNGETSNASNVNHDIQNGHDTTVPPDPEAVAFEDKAFYRFKESTNVHSPNPIVMDECWFARAGNVVLIKFDDSEPKFVESCEEQDPELPFGAHISVRGQIIRNIYGDLQDGEVVDVAIEKRVFFPPPRSGSVMLAGITDIGHDQLVMHVNVAAGTQPEFSQNNEANETMVVDLSNDLDELRSDIANAKMDSGSICGTKFRDEYFQTEPFLSQYFLEESCPSQNIDAQPQGANRGPGG